jgi:hypothetical protein
MPLQVAYRRVVRSGGSFTTERDSTMEFSLLTCVARSPPMPLQVAYRRVVGPPHTAGYQGISGPFWAGSDASGPQRKMRPGLGIARASPLLESPRGSVKK